MAAVETDAAIWDRVLAGRARDFGLLWDRHRDRVFRHALRLVDQPSDAEDVAAMVFLELWRRRAAARVVDGSLLPWLLVTTTNIGRNAARSRRRYRELLARLPDPPDAHDAAAAVEAREEATRRLARFRELAPADQRILALVAFEGCTTEDAAAVLGITPGAARTRLSRARARLEGS